MTKKQVNKQTERSMRLAVISTALCVIMLVGMTFAWFTATITSSQNVIMTAKFDAQVFWSEGLNAPETSSEAELSQDWTNLNNTHPYYDTSYMPGMETVRYFVFYNNSSFSVNFDLSLKEITCDNVLKDNLTVYKTLTVNDTALTSADMTSIGTMSSVIGRTDASGNSSVLSTVVAANSKKVVAVSVKLPETYNDNEQRIASFDVIVIASQYGIQEHTTATFHSNADTVLETPDVKVTVPANVTTNISDGDTLKLTVDPGEADPNLAIETGSGTTTYEVNLTNQNNVKVTSDEGIIVELNIGVVDLQDFYHNANPMNPVASVDAIAADGDYFYDVDSGIITFKTKSFSPFTAAYKFAGGLGTEQYPYLLDSRDHLEAINLETNAYHYYKMATPNDVIDATGMPFINLYGCFDGNGLTINNLSRALFYDAENDDTCVIKNLTLNANIARNSYFESAVALYPGNDIVFENVDVHGYIEGTAAAAYVALGPGPGTAIKYKFINCHSDATIVATGESAAGFIVHPYCGAGSEIILQNSRYTGNMAAKGNTYYFRVNSSGALDITTDESEGSTLYTNVANTYTGNSDLYTAGGTQYIKSSSKLSVENINEPVDISLLSIEKKANASYAVATLNIGPNDTNDKGNYTGVYINESCDIVDGNFVTKTIKNFNITINGDSTTTTGISEDGTTFNIINSYYGHTYGSASAKIIQYTESGEIVSIHSLNLKK